MSRRVLAVFLLLAIAWQTAVIAAPGAAFEAARERIHAALHGQDAAHHHHHGDGSVHEDDSADSVRHALADHGVSVTALLPAAARVHWLPAGSSSARAVDEASGTPPFLAGLRRPPRLFA